MQRARSETGELSVAVARQHVIIAVAEGHGEIRRRAGRADLDPADMSEMRGLRAGREIEKQIAIARPRENVGNSFARQNPSLLAPQSFERRANVVPFRRGDEADVAERR